MDTTPIIASLERAAELCDDLTPYVYRRLFAANPEIADKFILDKSHAVKGEMLAKAIDAILDFTGPGFYAKTLISAEAQNHDTFGIPRAVFGTFFPVIADTLRDLLGDDWTPEMAVAWSTLNARLVDLTQHADS